MFSPYRPAFCWQNTHHLIMAFHDLSEHERGRANSMVTFIGPRSSPAYQIVCHSSRKKPASSLGLIGIAGAHLAEVILDHLAFASLNQGTRKIMQQISLDLSSEVTPLAPEKVGRDVCTSGA